MYIVGVDPGKTGASAHMVDGNLIEVVPFDGDITRCRWVGQGRAGNPPTYFIERVTASPHMGVVSAFTFGRWAEAVESSVIFYERPYHMVRPVVWQNTIGVFSGGDKSKLHDHAKKLFPREHALKMFNKTTSDAVLIAYYGWRYMVNKEKTGEPL
ncbi:MAG: hypothetical protein KAU50_11435 [Candidatus Marinimicrobia bacterium]|nr:hypothetical protein [Candidatus Neomarinimicrobiota bacterium]